MGTAVVEAVEDEVSALRTELAEVREMNNRILGMLSAIEEQVATQIGDLLVAHLEAVAS